MGLGGVIFSLGSIYKSVNGYYESAKRYEDVQEIYDTSKRGGSDSDHDITSKMMSINSDYVGWITIHGTQIHYPVVKTDNNRFYLTHNFYKEKDMAGAIFMDYKNSTERLDKNIILYGHHMKDNSMFGSLKELTNQEFLIENRNIKFDFLGSTYTWGIFSVYADKGIEWLQTTFSTMNEFNVYLHTVRKKSMIASQIKVDQDDTILTLSTCTNEDEDERIIVHAKLIKKELDVNNEG